MLTRTRRRRLGARGPGTHGVLGFALSVVVIVAVTAVIAVVQALRALRRP